ncbi:D-2-hydroxyacid dehydrogenase [Novosphingobium bradum]|uniref:D-2-hydroxyacid dehydrogenase n=1 Tax=Novosphingobium bradum TaxID=1737444 RepID=A0ABV7IT94_9SPHN
MATPASPKFVMLPPHSGPARDWAARLMRDVPEIRLFVPEDEAGAIREIADADAAFGFLTPPLLAAASRLRWLQAPFAAPPAGFYYPALIEHELAVTNFREIYNDHIGAHIMALVLAFARGLQFYWPRQARGEWNPKGLRPAVHLPEATALIVGLGGIGAEAARLLDAFGVTVLATDARRTDPGPHVRELHGPEQLDSLLPRADFVILTIPHTPATEGLFDRARFQRMKPLSYFINIGRGMTTRLDDLADALAAGEISGAGLDVFEQEPLPSDHRLWHLPGVIITPHVAGRGPYLDERRYEILRDNCRQFARGAALRNVVDKANWF